MLPRGFKQQRKRTSMKNSFLVYIAFLAFGIFQMPESAIAVETSPKGKTVVLTDSIFNAKVDS